MDSRTVTLPFFSARFEGRQDFDMVRLGKHIERLNPSNLKSRLEQHLEISRHCGRRARDIKKIPNAEGGKRGDKVGVKALSGGIDNGRRKSFAFPMQTEKDRIRSSRSKACPIGKIVGLCARLCTADRVMGDFYAQRSNSFPCERQSKQTRATVDIQYRVDRSFAGPFDGMCDELFGDF